MKFWEALKKLYDNECKSIFLHSEVEINNLRILSTYMGEKSPTDIFDFLIGDWGITEAPLLNWAYVLNGLGFGRVFKRKSWNNHTIRMDPLQFDCAERPILGDNGIRATFTIDDFLANDWIEVKK